MRYKILMVSPMFLIDICKEGEHHVKVAENAVPNDIKFIRAFTNDSTGWGMIGIVVESETFNDLNEGDEIPILSHPHFSKV